MILRENKIRLLFDSFLIIPSVILTIFSLLDYIVRYKFHVFITPKGYVRLNELFVYSYVRKKKKYCLHNNNDKFFAKYGSKQFIDYRLGAIEKFKKLHPNEPLYSTTMIIDKISGIRINEAGKRYISRTPIRVINAQIAAFCNLRNFTKQKHDNKRPIGRILRLIYLSKPFMYRADLGL